MIDNRTYIGPPSAFAFNLATLQGKGALTVGGKTEARSFTRIGGMCPRCEGRGTVSDIDLTQLYDEDKSLNEGAITVPGYKTDGWWTVGIFTDSGFLDGDKPIKKYTK